MLAHAERPRQVSGPSISYKESHGLRTTLAGNTQKTKEFVTEKNLEKNTRNNKVYAQPMQEIQGKPWFFDRSLKPGQTKLCAPRGDPCSGFKFIYDKRLKGLDPPGAFLRPGASKNAKNQKTSKAEPCVHKRMKKKSHKKTRIFAKNKKKQKTKICFTMFCYVLLFFPSCS